MPFEIQYGPISAALGLARQAGLAQRQRTVFGQDQDFLNYVQQAQNHQDSLYATQVQNALGVKEFNSNLGLQQQQQNANIQHSNAELELAKSQQAATNAYRQATAQQREESIQNQENRTDLSSQKYGDKQDAIQNLPPELQSIVQATGRMPYIPNSVGQDHSFQQLEAEYKRLTAAEAVEQKTQKNFSVDPKDLIGPRSEPGTIPGVAKGFEKQYSASQQRLQQIQAAKQQIEGALGNQTQSLLTPGQKPGAAPSPVLKYLQSLTTRQQPQGNDNQQNDAGQPPVVHNAQEYAQLPSGTLYVNANTGQKAQKP